MTKENKDASPNPIGSIFTRWPTVKKSPFELEMERQYPNDWQDHVSNCDKQLNPEYVRRYLEPYFVSRVQLNNLVSLWEHDYKDAIEKVKQRTPEDSSAINVTDRSDTTSPSPAEAFNSENPDTPGRAPSILQFNHWLEQYMLHRMGCPKSHVTTTLEGIRGFDRNAALHYLKICGFSQTDRNAVILKQPFSWPYPNPAPHTEEGRAESYKALPEPSRARELDHDAITENGFTVRLPKGTVKRIESFVDVLTKLCEPAGYSWGARWEDFQKMDAVQAKAWLEESQFSRISINTLLAHFPTPWLYPIVGPKDLRGLLTVQATEQATVQAEASQADPQRAPYALVYGPDKVLMCDPFEQAWVESNPPMTPEAAMTLADDIMYLRNKKNVYAHVVDFMLRKAKVPREVLHNLMLTWLEVHPIQGGHTDGGLKLEVIEDKDAFYARQATAEELEEERTEAIKRITALEDALCWAYAAMATARRNETTVARMDELPVEARPYLMQGQNVMTMAMREVEALLPKIAKDNG